MNSNYFGNRIFTLMQENGLTQRELAKKVGVTEVSMSRYISGIRIPNGAIVARIAVALHISVDQLLGVNLIEDDTEFEYYKIKQAIINNANSWTPKQKADLVLELFKSTIF